MEEKSFTWESIKTMTDKTEINKEITRIENERRRLLRRLDYLNICKNEIEKNQIYQNEIYQNK